LYSSANPILMSVFYHWRWPTHFTWSYSQCALTFLIPHTAYRIPHTAYRRTSGPEYARCAWSWRDNPGRWHDIQVICAIV